MSSPEPPAHDPWPSSGADDLPHVPVSPLGDEDPPRVGDFWLDARLAASPAGVAYTAHDDQQRAVLVVLLSEGAAADAAARDRLAGVVNAMHIDAVVARGGQGQDTGRLGRRFRPEDDGPVTPDARPGAPWVALATDGSPQAAAAAVRVLDDVQLATVPPQGAAAGPDYQHYWVDHVRPGLARLWPLPWPGRYDRAGWRTILVSWLLMLLIAALAVLIAILIFRNQPPQQPPTPTGQSATATSTASAPSSGSPSPQSGSPSPQSGSPSPSSSGSPSGSGSPSPSPSGSGSGSASASPSPSPAPSSSESGGSPASPGESGPPASESPRSRL